MPTIYDKVVRYHDLNGDGPVAESGPAAGEAEPEGMRLTRQDDANLCMAFQIANEWYPGRDGRLQISCPEGRAEAEVDSIINALVAANFNCAWPRFEDGRWGR